ncbi:NmrA family NAD(P)-binding protein [Brevibacterium casei]
MYVIAGATGRVGSAAARLLLDSGADTRVLVRRPGDAADWEAAGAEAVVTGLDDEDGLSAALSRADGFFVLLPFDLGADDLDAHADRLIVSITGAVARAAVPHVVMLSSGGADLVTGTGPITGLHRLEQALLTTGTRLTALRSGHFQEKVSDVIDLARATGTYPVFADSAEVPVPMVATRDLGALAARAMLDPPKVSEAVDVIGPARTEREVAEVLGRGLGRELTVELVPEPAWAGALTAAGFRPHVADSLAELYRADAAGLLAPRGNRSVTVDTTIEETIAGLLAVDGTDDGVGERS